MKFPLLLLSCFVVFWVRAQERVITVGMQVKPIFSSNLFGTGPAYLTDSSVNYTFAQHWGYAAGMVIRRGYTKTLSVECGINFIARNYTLTATEGSEISSASFRIVGYEIPLSQLVFIRLGEQLYMNASGGFCINMFPSDIFTENSELRFYAGRNLIFNPSLIANIGFEYRTPKSGYFYVGSSFNRPFTPIYRAAAEYLKNQTLLSSVFTDLRGSYLTFDVRYFFPEDPQRKKLKQKKQ